MRLTGWLCAAVQIGDPADQVIRMLRGQTARCSVDPLGSADSPSPALSGTVICEAFILHHKASVSGDDAHKSPNHLDYHSVTGLMRCL